MADPSPAMSGPSSSTSVVLLAAVVVVMGGCLYDPDSRCGPEQELDERGVCVCAPDMVPRSDASGCEPCGDNEIAAGSTCACAAGHARGDDGICAPSPDGLGASCALAGPPCAASEFSHCQPVDEAWGYCTRAGCADDTDCPDEYACELDGESPYCRRPPSGLGLACQDSGDCAGHEADYCETYSLGQCLVSGCSLAPDDCFPGWGCCDLSTLGLDTTLCLPEGTCPTS